ncbi:MAG: hypothetical protein VX435_09655 [Planctomycetota bacterium]|nr:hypothetical protein [Planctomycetota bacterium]
MRSEPRLFSLRSRLFSSRSRLERRPTRESLFSSLLPCKDSDLRFRSRLSMLSEPVVTSDLPDSLTRSESCFFSSRARFRSSRSRFLSRSRLERRSRDSFFSSLLPSKRSVSRERRLARFFSSRSRLLSRPRLLLRLLLDSLFAGSRLINDFPVIPDAFPLELDLDRSLRALELRLDERSLRELLRDALELRLDERSLRELLRDALEPRLAERSLRELLRDALELRLDERSLLREARREERELRLAERSLRDALRPRSLERLRFCPMVS